MAAVEAVLVDWAGTMTEPLRDVVVAAVTAAGLDQDQLREAFAGLAAYVTSTDTPIHRAERGEITDDELLAWMTRTAPGARAVFDAGAPGSIFSAADRPAMVDLVRRLRDHGVRVVLATNNFATAQPLLEQRYVATGLVDDIVNSALVGARKPEPRFFQRCLDVAGVPADRLVLVDDMAANVEAARALGLRGVVVDEDPSAAIDAVAALAGLGDGT